MPRSDSNVSAHKEREHQSGFATTGPLKISTTSGFYRTTVSQVPLVVAEGRVTSLNISLCGFHHAHSPKMGTLTVFVRHACGLLSVFPVVILCSQCM